VKEDNMQDTDNIKHIIDRLRVVQENELDMDNSQLAKLTLLAKDGLVDEEDVRVVRTAMIAMNAGRLPTLPQRTVLMKMLGTLVDMITANPSMFSRLRTELRKDDE
jgi:hypothetical protein